MGHPVLLYPVVKAQVHAFPACKIMFSSSAFLNGVLVQTDNVQKTHKDSGEIPPEEFECLVQEQVSRSHNQPRSACQSRDNQLQSYSNEQLSKQIFYSELKLGSRSVGQRKSFKDILKASLKKCNVDLAIWEGKAANRAEWKQTQSRCCTSGGI